MIRYPILLALCIATTLSAGCVISCEDYAASSVNVTVSDPAGQPIPDAQVGYLPASEDWADYELCEQFGDEETWVCGWEIAGEIEIEVTADGFQPHVETVFVDSDECHVIPEQLDVELQPAT